MFRGVISCLPKVRACAKLLELLTKHAVDEDPWQRLLQTLTTFFSKMPAATKTCVEAASWAQHVALMMKNTYTRDLAYSLLEAVSAFTVWPESPQEAVDEWKAHKVASTEETSFLARAINAIALQAKFVDHRLDTCSSKDQDCEVAMQLEDGEQH